MRTVNDKVVRISTHYEQPPTTIGGHLEMVGGREMLRLGDKLEYDAVNRVYTLTEYWQPGNFDKALYA